jgi:hypothetical protein
MSRIVIVLLIYHGHKPTDLIHLELCFLKTKYFSQKFWGFGLYPWSGILKARKHNISESGFVSIFR